MSGRSRTLGRARLLGLYLVLAALLAAARPTTASLLAGALIAGMGEAIRLWAAGHLTKTTTLATSGPYAWVRHPLYLGRLLILIGLTVAAPLPRHLNLGVLVCGAAAFFIYYLPRKERVEGRRLLERHGPAYEAYRAATPALLPGARRFPGSRGAWSYAALRRNREVWVLAGLVLVFGWLALESTAR